MNQQPKGICRMAVVPMRNTASHTSPMISQLLFGEHYEVINEEGDWVQIELAFDHSQGWICKNQHSPITEEYYKQINLSDYKVCMDLSGSIFFQKKNVNIVLGSVLPITTNELFKLEEQIAFNGSAKSLSQRRDFDFMRDEIKKFEHAPYVMGGKTPFGIDEAGFIQQLFKLCGYKLPRTILAQSKAGKKVESLSKILAGDLVYVLTEQPQGYIYLGKEVFIGVSNGEVRRINHSFNETDPIAIRRILQENM
ncbi:C40 family peptidase [Reichenbachiella agarivorans]|uniref:C40 family peptidase n=1 Tax=Reichenbachiella agarivorans TaxID=2979464 RepID=A0ABY6CK18_9BACT|nr:C40 family peptidase [Reichenbachiella agarivorans]UXP30872.1 C40 family peptidase [Reichenbachiella agarivorans]